MWIWKKKHEKMMKNLETKIREQGKEVFALKQINNRLVKQVGEKENLLKTKEDEATKLNVLLCEISKKNGTYKDFFKNIRLLVNDTERNIIGNNQKREVING